MSRASRAGSTSRRARLPIVIALVATSFASAWAAGPREEPPEICKAQVSRAADLVAKAYAGVTRKVASGAPGSVEHAVKGYVGTTVHSIDEGSIPPRASGTCPSDMAKVAGSYCVDKYEGSLLERAADGTLTPADPYHPPDPSRVYVARSVAGVVPQGYVSAKEAERACKEAKKRLCQAVEWRVACAGSEGTAFPYGPSRVVGKCHDTGKSPMLTFHAETMSRGWGRVELNDPRNNALEGGLAKTGAFPDCVNDLGLFDMVGNLHEWTADPNGTFQGGFWLDTSRHGEGCAYRTVAHDFSYHDYSTGFRCCADPSGS